MTVGLGGVGAVLAVSAAQAVVDANVGTGTANPFCNTCRAPTGVQVTTLPPDWRARLDPSWQWVCPRCWQRIA